MAVLSICHEFLTHIEDHKESGLTCAGETAQFIPRSVAQEFWTPQRIRTLRAYTGISTSPNVIRDSYLVVLSVLAAISVTVEGSLQFLDILVSRRRTDATLPWLECPDGLKEQHFQAGQAGPVWLAFSKCQWSFCPVLLELGNPLSNTRLSSQSIFAFNDRVELGSPHVNREATVYSVAVHKGAHGHLPDAPQLPSRIVFKVYPQAYKRLYDKECRAYAALSSRPPNILRCLGSFYWSSAEKVQTHTLILEYAEMGTLLDLFKVGRCPYEVPDIIAIWESLHRMVEGLETIHQQDGLRAIHQDLKPSNILVFPPRSSQGKGRFSYTFKISDFGGCHMPTGGESQNGNDAVYSRTSRTYSAPELQLGEDIRYNVDSRMDLWSVGCILVEAAVWIALGESGREDFRRARMQEAAQLPEHMDRGRVDCFHDGNTVLRSVVDVQEQISRSRRPGDNISVEVVQLALNTLLVDRSYRNSARQLHATLGKVIHSCRLIYDAAQTQKGESAGLFNAPSSPLSQRSHTSGVFSDRRISDIRSPTLSATSSTTTNPQESLSDWSRPGPSATEPATTPSKPRHKPSSYPNLSIEDLIRWRNSTARAPALLAGWKEAKPVLENRDFVFIIDNSASMQQYMDGVLSVVPCLGYLVKHLDSNGLQLLMTSNPHRMMTYTTSTQMRDFIANSFPSGPAPCPIEIALQKALKDVYESMPLLAPTGSRKTIPKMRTLWKKAKPFSILVFTNGVWDDSEDGVSNADLPIEKCIDLMRANNVHRTDVAVQFVRFGNDEKGIKRLTFLDDELVRRPRNDKYDIVDHKSIDDSIWDILIGSVSLVIDDRDKSNGVSAGETRSQS